MLDLVNDRPEAIYAVVRDTLLRKFAIEVTQRDACHHRFEWTRQIHNISKRVATESESDGKEDIHLISIDSTHQVGGRPCGQQADENAPSSLDRKQSCNLPRSGSMAPRNLEHGNE